MRSRLSTTLITICTLTPALASATVPEIAESAPRATSSMAWVTGGWYRPLYAAAEARRVRVASFALDRVPVTRGDYLRFVRTHPEWRRDAVRPGMAEPAYLADWPAASSAGAGSDLDRPVTGVSWFAARAYCAAYGKRLPDVDEWEYAASASETRRDASGDAAFRRRLMALYSTRQPGLPARIRSTFTNAYGVSDLHGLVWEWTADFDHAKAPDGTRAHARGEERHLYCASAAIGVIDPSNYPAFARFAVRAGLTNRSTVSGVGFRCAADLPV